MYDNDWYPVCVKNVYNSMKKQKQQKRHQVIHHKWKKIKTHFTKEDVLLSIKHMKNCLALLVNRKMQIKPTMTYLYIRTRMAKIKRKAYKEYFLKGFITPNTSKDIKQNIFFE